ncbi:hypothetical protein [Wolbachia endosymbiont (group B) of Ennomos erosarius]|uniref:hypothetical protein n=1 Tax=Wolbachia endosymbiont (group B) of Ennomos erosarius TaxID=3066175 RepID=UPI003132DCE2
MVNLICFFITAEFTLFSCLFYSPLIQNSRLRSVLTQKLLLERGVLNKPYASS